MNANISTISTQKLHIKLDREFRPRGYDIILGSGLLEEAGAIMRQQVRDTKPVIVTETIVAKHHLAKLEKSLKSVGYEPRSIVVKINEKTKTLTTANTICRKCLKLGVDRGTTIIILGGGVIGDVGAFAASILLRGLNYVQLPTTLLSQVDSAIGGKTGVNTLDGKNMIGTFHQPKLVISDVSTLATLPKKQMLAGYAEMLKHGVVEDRELFTWLRDDVWRRIIERDERVLVTAIYRSSAIKARIIASDEREQSRRMLLNLGHTFGHALEYIAKYDPDKMPHGFAVSIGMVMAAKLSLLRGLISETQVQMLIDHLKDVGLPSKPSDILDRGLLTVKAFEKALSLDKKRSSGQMSFVLMQGIGRAIIEREVSSEELRDFLKEYLKNN